jgi:hypothetical protein
MENQPIQQNPSITPIPEQPILPPVQPTDGKKHASYPIGMIILACTIVGLGIIIGSFSTNFGKQTATTIQSTPTPEATQSAVVTNHGPSYIATQSAFLTIQTMVASLSATITAVTTNDTSMKPPVLDLPLGFTSN